ncbi:hypothetical protein BLSTO_04825 [Blastocystis sp. subtype 1]
MSEVKPAYVIDDYNGSDDTQLSLQKGDMVAVIRNDGYWCYCYIDERYGYFPTAYLEFVFIIGSVNG